MTWNKCFCYRRRVTCHKVLWVEASFEYCCFRVRLPDSFVCVCVYVYERERERERAVFNMLLTSAHGSQFTRRREAVISWCCYPESSHPPLSVYSGISWCNQLHGCLTNQWEADKFPYHATLLSVSPTLDLKQMIAGFVCSFSFVQWGTLPVRSGQR